MKNTFVEVKRELDEFHSAYPRPCIPDLLSRLKHIEHSQMADWPKLWSDKGVLRENAEDPCVYFFFDGVGDLLYIGSTQILGKRFYQHFDTKGAKWKDLVMSLAILVIPRESWFEVYSIETYFIQKLQPPKNTIGKAPIK